MSRYVFIKITIRIFYFVLLGIVCLWAIGFIRDRQFVGGEMSQWMGAVAEIKDSIIKNESLTLESETDINDNTKWYKRYSVSYAYAAEFYAWGDIFAFEESGTNTGKTSEYDVSIPTYAYDFPKKGETVNVIYDPEALGSYRIGSKEDWQKKTELSFGNLLVPISMSVIAAILIIVDIREFMKYRRHAEFVSDIPEDDDFLSRQSREET